MHDARRLLWIACISIIFGACSGKKENADDTALKKQKVGWERPLDVRLPSRVTTDQTSLGSFDRDIGVMLERLTGLDYGEDYNAQLVSLARAYAKTDPDAGIAWILSLDPNLDNLSAYSSFAGALEKQNPGSSLAFFSMVEADSAKSAYLLAATKRLAASDPEQAIKALREMGQGLDGIEGIERDVVRQMARRGHLDAAWDFAKELDGGTIRSGDTLDAFFGNDFGRPSEAFDFSSQLKDPNLIAESARAYLRNLPESKLRELSKYLGEVPDGVWKNSAIVGLIDKLFTKSPEDAAHWVNALPEGAMREEAYDKISKYAKLRGSDVLDRVNAVRYPNDQPSTE